MEGVSANDETHKDEHAIEVQLPFLYNGLIRVPIIPLNAGAASAELVADVVERLLDDSTLLLISSDLSHYLNYNDANQVDAITLKQIMKLEGALISQQACGATPINGVLELARRHNWEPVLLAACNSGDTAGDKDRVVGYCAVAFYEGATKLNTPNAAVAGTESKAAPLPNPLDDEPSEADLLEAELLESELLDSLELIESEA
jgi:AmmeMemoRadiSam system protein B